MSGARRAWWTFACCALAAVLGLGWLSVHVVALERTEAESRDRAAQSERTRLALWRMDSWLNAQLAPEAARPSFDYVAFHGQTRAWTRGLGAIAPGEVVTPSPLLTFRSELFPLHFQVRGPGALTSPQVPTASERDLAEAALGVAEDLPRREQALGDLARFVRYDDLAARFGQAATSPMNCVSPAPPANQDRTALDVQSRIYNSNVAKNPVQQQASWNVIAPDVASPGPLLAVWLDAADGDEQLVFARRVDQNGAAIYQGVVVDWSVLERALLEQVVDLFDGRGVDLVRDEREDGAQLALRLANVPARLVAEPPPTRVTAIWSPTRTVLAVAWAALVLGIGAIGWTLGSALSFGHERARFASAVTHELRSPLTTFRLYTEMLAEGMVSDPAQRDEYVRTLHRESDRLARFVENVLTHARIEEGRQPLRRERLSVTALVERIRPVLERRAADGGLTLRVTGALPDVSVEVDPDAVEQILFGLCDNACKYAAGGPGEAVLELRARREGDWLEIALRDHGPGVPPEHRLAIFRAFERGARPTGESVVPGVGLGLAVGRGLAHALGGELLLRPCETDGACFVLRLPA